MASIKFDIIGNSDSFVASMRQVQEQTNKTSAVLQRMTKDFDVEGIENQFLSLTRLVRDSEDSIRVKSENIARWLDDAINARNAGDFGTYNAIIADIDEETKSIERLTAETKEYKQALSEISSLRGFGEESAPMLFSSQEEFDRVVSLRDGIEELQSKIAQFRGSDEELQGLRTELSEMQDALRQSEMNAAQAAEQLGQGGRAAAEASQNYYQLTNEIEKQQSVVNDLALKLNGYRDALDRAKLSGDIDAIDKATIEYDAYADALQSAKMRLINLRAEQEQYKNSFSGDTTERMRTQIMRLTQEIAELTIKYRSLSAEEKRSSVGRELELKINSLTSKAGKLRDAMTDVQKAITAEASDTRAFDALAGGINVVTSSFGAATGAAAMFGVKEEELQDIQAKLQASLAISNALSVVQNQLQKESALMRGITTIQTKALAKAEVYERLVRIQGNEATRIAIIRQKAFNAVAKANPYVLLAMAIVSVVGALSALSAHSKQAKKDEEERQKQMEKSKEYIDKYNSELVNSVVSYRNLQHEYKNLKSVHEKTEWINNNTKKFHDLGVEVNSIKDADRFLIDNTSDIIKAFDLRARAAAYAAKITSTYSDALEGVKYQEGDKISAKEFEELFPEIGESYESNEYANFSSGLFRRLNGKFELTEAGAEELRKRALDKAEHDSQKLFDELDSINKEASDLFVSAGVNEYNEERDKANKERSNREAQALRDEWKNQEELAKLKREGAKAASEAEIAGEEIGYIREQRLREAQHKNRIADIKAQEDEIYKAIYEQRKKEWERTHKDSPYELTEIGKQSYGGVKGTLNDTEQEYFDARYAKLRAELDKENAEWQRYQTDLADEEANAKDEYLVNYGNYEQKRISIIEQYAEKAKDAKNEWELKSIESERDEQLQQLDIDYGVATNKIANLFADMSEKTVAELRKIHDEGEKAIKFISEGVWDESKASDLGITKAIFDKYKNDPEALKSITDQLDNIESRANECDTAFGKMANAIKKLSNAKKGTTDVNEALQDLSDSIGSANSAVGFLQSSLSSLGDAFDIDGMEVVTEGLEVATSAVSSTLSGVQAGAAFGPIGAAIGGAIGLVTSLASSIAKIHDKKKQKEIDDYAKRIKALGDAYDELGEEIDKAYSTDKSQKIQESNKLLEQQIIYVQRQMAAEQAKNKTDKDAVEGYKDKLKDLRKQIEENEEAAFDAIFGSDIRSAIEGFASAMTSAWENEEDAARNAKDVVKNMMKSMVDESVKVAIQSSDAMTRIRDKMAKFYADGVFTASEREELEREAEDLQRRIDDKFAWAKDLYGEDEEYSQQASSRGFQAMSQDVGEELNGRFTALQIAGESMNINTTLILENMNAMMELSRMNGVTFSELRNLAITRNSYLEDIAKYSKRMFLDFTDRLDELVDNTKYM